MKTRTLSVCLSLLLVSSVYAQQVVIKGILRCTNGATTSTKGAVNIIIIPSFNPKASVSTTTTPQGFFQISTGWPAKDLLDKNISLYIITKCSSCKKVERIFVSEDLDKRNTDTSKLFVTVKGWKLLDNCSETELPDLLSARLLDSAYKLPPEAVSGNATGSAAVSPVSFLNLFTKLASIPSAAQGVGYFQVYAIPPGKIKYGNFLHASPITNTDNAGFNFSPNRNLSEAVFWNASAIAFSRQPHNVSLISNYKNNIKLSGYQQMANRFYIGIGGIYTKQDEARQVVYYQGNPNDNPFTTTIPHTEKLEEYAVYLAPAYGVNSRLSLGASVKSIWQRINNPVSAFLRTDNNTGQILESYFTDDTVKTQHFDVDISASYKISSSVQAGISVMNLAGSKLYGDLFIRGKTNPMYVNQRAYGAGVTYKRERLNIGVDGLFTDDGFYDVSLGVNYVPFNNGLLAAGYAFKQQSVSVMMKIKHFKIAYLYDNNLMINDVKRSKNSLFNGRIYSGFSFDF